MESERKKKTLTVAEMAEYLNVSLTTAYRLARESGFPAVRLTPGKIVIPVVELEKWLAEHAGKAGERA